MEFQGIVRALHGILKQQRAGRRNQDFNEMGDERAGGQDFIVVSVRQRNASG